MAAGPLPADTAWCAVAAQPAPRPPRSATDEPATTSEPAPDRARRLRDTLRRAQEAAYPQRGALPPAAAAGGLACAGQVAQGLNLRAAGGPVGADDVRGVLRTIGLAEVTVRSAGADGLAFAGWTGQACVFGTRRAGRDSIGYGVRRPGGSCLPADG